jgi:hypothetical protein
MDTLTMVCYLRDKGATTCRHGSPCVVSGLCVPGDEFCRDVHADSLPDPVGRNGADAHVRDPVEDVLAERSDKVVRLMRSDRGRPEHVRDSRVSYVVSEGFSVASSVEFLEEVDAELPVDRALELPVRFNQYGIPWFALDQGAEDALDRLVILGVVQVKDDHPPGFRVGEAFQVIRQVLVRIERVRGHQKLHVAEIHAVHDLVVFTGLDGVVPVLVAEEPVELSPCLICEGVVLLKYNEELDSLDFGFPGEGAEHAFQDERPVRIEVVPVKEPVAFQAAVRVDDVYSIAMGIEMCADVSGHRAFPAAGGADDGRAGLAFVESLEAAGEYVLVRDVPMGALDSQVGRDFDRLLCVRYCFGEDLQIIIPVLPCHVLLAHVRSDLDANRLPRMRSGDAHTESPCEFFLVFPEGFILAVLVHVEGTVDDIDDILGLEENPVLEIPVVCCDRAGQVPLILFLFDAVRDRAKGAVRAVDGCSGYDDVLEFLFVHEITSFVCCVCCSSRRSKRGTRITAGYGYPNACTTAIPSVRLSGGWRMTCFTSARLGAASMRVCASARFRWKAMVE